MKHFFKVSQQIKLSDADKTAMRRDMVDFMQTHGVVEPATLSAGGWRHLTFRQAIITAVVVVAIVFSTGTTYAAGYSLPGDTLYPVKRALEETRLALIANPTNKAKWNAARIERRVGEAALLASQGRLNTEQVQILQEQIEEHLTTFDTELAQIKSEGRREVAEALEAAIVTNLERYERHLASLEEEAAASEEAAGNDTIRPQMATGLVPTTDEAVRDQQQPLESLRSLLRERHDRLQTVRDEQRELLEEREQELREQTSRLREELETEVDIEINERLRAPEVRSVPEAVPVQEPAQREVIELPRVELIIPDEVEAVRTALPTQTQSEERSRDTASESETVSESDTSTTTQPEQRPVEQPRTEQTNTAPTEPVERRQPVVPDSVEVEGERPDRSVVVPEQTSPREITRRVVPKTSTDNARIDSSTDVGVRQDTR